jgi:16S rRNA (cytosine1402-N4)-methyltransferase
MSTPHTPVLLDEVIKSFEAISEGYFVDCTLGYGGHSGAILEHYPHIKHIGIDRDEEALAFSRERLSLFAPRSRLYKGTFATLFPTLQEEPIMGVLADFGVSSLQLDKRERGFAFDAESLDMRMDSDAPLSAMEVVNGYSQERLAYLFENYGEVRGSHKLAQAIVQQRAKAPITSAKALSDLICSVMPKRGKIHPATLPFQAIRIEVNSELAEIEGLLDAIEKNHHEGQIVSLISFHSLEDRLVKRRFQQWAKSCICDPHMIRCVCGNNHQLGRASTSKPITATKEELRTNPRSRSAKLRTFRFTKGV